MENKITSFILGIISGLLAYSCFDCVGKTFPANYFSVWDGVEVLGFFVVLCVLGVIIYKVVLTED